MLGLGILGKAAATAGVTALMTLMPMCSGSPSPYNLYGDVTTRGQVIQHYYHVAVHDDTLGLMVDHLTTGLNGTWQRKVVNQHVYSVWIENDECPSNVVTRQILNVLTTVRNNVC